MQTPTLGFRAVLYTHDLEPITVLQLSAEAREYLQKRGEVRLAVREPFSLDSLADGPEGWLKYGPKMVTIRAETLHYHGQRSLMLFTADEENALLLQAAFLPGQQRDLEHRREDAFASGFLAALGALGQR